MYELLHPLHGVVRLQQRSHSHETFIAALLFHFLFLLLLASSPFIFIYSSVLVALWDGLPRQETDVSLGWTGWRHFLIFWTKSTNVFLFRAFKFLMVKRREMWLKDRDGHLYFYTLLYMMLTSYTQSLLIPVGIILLSTCRWDSTWPQKFPEGSSSITCWPAKSNKQTTSTHRVAVASCDAPCGRNESAVACC